MCEFEKQAQGFAESIKLPEGFKLMVFVELDSSEHEVLSVVVYADLKSGTTEVKRHISFWEYKEFPFELKRKHINNSISILFKRLKDKIVADALKV